jgi:NAD(P)H dehydrogenase (quinone)
MHQFIEGTDNLQEGDDDMTQPRVLIVFDGREDGLVERMARKVAEGARGTGADVLMLTAGNATPEDALERDVVILGSPCHFGGPSVSMKRFMDSTWNLRGKLAGKVGAAFTAATHLAGGHELTLVATIAFFLTHGMIVEGSAQGDSLGATLIAPGGEYREALADDPEEGRLLGERAVRLAMKLKS